MLARGLPKIEIESRGYFTLNEANRLKILNHLKSKYSTEELKRVPGIFLNFKTNELDFVRLDGLAIPVRDQEGQIRAYKIRRDIEDVSMRYSYLSSSRFKGLGCGAHLHVPLHNFSDLSVIRITEGELKADIATALGKILTIGIPGVTMWSKAHDFVQKNNVKKIYFAYDMDFMTNPNVGAALENAVSSFLATGISVEVETWKQ